MTHLTDLRERLTLGQRQALLTDERAIERLPFKERDQLIAAGLAHRAWPQKTGDGQWRTWLTEAGVRFRRELVGSPYPDSLSKGSPDV